MRGATLALLATCLLLAWGIGAVGAIVPYLPENAVWSDTVRGLDGSWISVVLNWYDMPTRDGLPTYNADRTFYPGDSFRVMIRGERSEWYDGSVMCWGAVNYTTFGVGRSFERKIDLEVATSASAGLREAKFGFFPAKGVIEVKTVDENGLSGNRNIYIEGELAGTGTVTRNVEQGTFTVTFGPGPENVRTPPPATVEITPGRRVRVTARYAYENSQIKEGTYITVLENGSPWMLSPVIAVLKVQIVSYDPKFVVIPYIWMNWESEGRVYWSYELPFAVLVRYDGNRYDPENENRISLDQRAIVDGISLVGVASWPLRSLGDQQRYRDNGELDYHENGDPVMYRDGDMLYFDNGTVKLQIADITVKPTHYGFDTLEVYPSFHKLENVRETVYHLREIYGYDLFKQLRTLGAQVSELIKTLQDAGPFGIDVNIFRFTNNIGKPFVFDESKRYHKFAFTIEDQVRSLFSEWQGTLSLDMTLWNVASGPSRTIRTGIQWSPLGFVQPIAVNAWRLSPWARAAVENEPYVVYQDNAWTTDFAVSFKMEFVPIYKFEDFMSIVSGIAENIGSALEPMLGREGLESMLPAFEELFENMGLAPRMFQEYIPVARDALYSLAHIDEQMMRIITADTKWSDEPQVIEGRGVRSAEVERRGLSLFALRASAWISPDNVFTKSDLTDLPFENKEFAIDVNLSGEGMSVEVVEDTGIGLTLRLHAPARSGGLQTARILDNEGAVLFQRTFLPASFYRLPGLSWVLGADMPDPFTPQELALHKTPTSPTEIYVELTNSWGATYTKKISILPCAMAVGIDAIPWRWLIAAGMFLALWVGFMNWLAKRRGATGV